MTDVVVLIPNFSKGTERFKDTHADVHGQRSSTKLKEYYTIKCTFSTVNRKFQKNTRTIIY